MRTAPRAFFAKRAQSQETKRDTRYCVQAKRLELPDARADPLVQGLLADVVKCRFRALSFDASAGGSFCPRPWREENFMKFLCAVYFEPKAMEGLSRSEGAELNRVSLNYNEELRKGGHFIAASALQWPKTAKTVRRRDAKISVKDGPFAETKEVLGGFIFIEARDMEEAVEIAGKIPMARLGSIEVRPEMSIG
jgi:hypothetical protein